MNKPPPAILTAEIAPHITDIFSIGAGAAGKGTLARGLKGIPERSTHLEMSRILDWVGLHRPDIVLPHAHLRAAGKLYPDKVTMQCLHMYADHRDIWGGVVIYDGPGRTVPQLDELESLISVRRTEPLVVVLDLRVSVDVAVERARQRIERTKKAGGTPRNDDQESTVRERFELFEDSRPALLETFRRFAVVSKEIDANGSPRDKLLASIEALHWTEMAQNIGLL